MAVWNFEKLQGELDSLAIKLDTQTVYPQAAIDRLLDVMARSIPVDEQFYRSRYPDVDEATRAGDVASASQHYVEHGFYEDRIPCDVVVDEEAYLTLYPDIAEGIESGGVASATDHWIRYGRNEERNAYLQLKQLSGKSRAAAGGARKPKRPA
ncbi:hypothetical protein [Microvirga antarctica]|uniref:hypothetical protein n=1 Tax=Microvirga antarctica TaxID=2819233 RepID=UPI001B31002D|nr:hypothetical protein [Microvirga antarctica]